MKRFVYLTFIVMFAVILGACANGISQPTPVPPTATSLPLTNTIAPSLTPSPMPTNTPTATQEPTSTPTKTLTRTPTPEPVLITSNEELIGFYYFDIPQPYPDDYFILQFNVDGTFQFGTKYDVKSQSVKPTAYGEWWFEDNTFRIIDTYSGTVTLGWTCEPGKKGTYQVFRLPREQIAFYMVKESCTKEGIITIPRSEILERKWKVGIPSEYE